MPDDGRRLEHPPHTSDAPTQPSFADGAKAPPYPPAADTPTQIGPLGIRFDFNLGARVVLPSRTDGTWRVRLRDLDSGNILFESENQGAFVNSAKRWFIRFGVKVWDQTQAEPVFTHTYDARDKAVLI